MRGEPGQIMRSATDLRADLSGAVRPGRMWGAGGGGRLTGEDELIDRVVSLQRTGKAQRWWLTPCLMVPLRHLYSSV